MKRHLLVKLTAGFLSAVMLFTSVQAECLLHNVFAAEADSRAAIQVQFTQEYAEVGKELSVSVSGAENVSYTWYVDGAKISNTGSSYVPKESDLESMIRVVAASGNQTAEDSLYFSKLPVVYIDTNGQAITSKEDYIDATMQIQGNAEYNLDTTTLYNGAIEIRGRGNTTWGMPKKPYKIKLDKKTDVFGMGKNKHWVLLANYSDESLMRNTLSYDFSGSLGMEQMSTVWTSVVMNGEYVGNYQFCEQVRVDETRVDVFDWEGFAEDSAAVIAKAEGMNDDLAGDLETYMLEKDMSWITSGKVSFNNKTYLIANYPDIKVPSINGGYVLELDEYYDEVSKFRTNSNQPIMFKNPEFVATNSDMMKFVQTYVQTFEDSVRSTDYTATYDGEKTHYSELYDFDALVDYWLVSEIFFNEELNKKSTYMYKEIDELMKMGPIWDMDYSSGGEGQTYQTEQWATHFFNANAQSVQWYKYLVKDPYFLMKAQERYWEIRYDETADMLESINTHYEYLKESGAADYEYWLRKSGRTTSFDQEVTRLKSWFDTHMNWLDRQMETEDTLGVVFYSKSGNLQLTLTDAEGNALKNELALKAPADAVVEPNKDIKLSVSGTNSGRTATVFVNGRIFGTITVGETITIPATALTELVGSKNVIEVKAPDVNGNITGSNYITVKQKSSGDDMGVQKSKLETLVYEALEKHQTDYSSDSWSVFQSALNDAYAVLLDTKAEQSAIDQAEAALRHAINALVISKNPASDADDYDMSKIKYSAGSAQTGEGIELAFDKNEETYWHTQYSPRPEWYGTEDALEHFWVLFEMENVAVLDAVRYLPRGGNGDILGYRVEGSLDGENWVDLTDGEWAQNGATWKVAEFAPTELKYVRMWATATTSSSGANRHVSARELRLRTGEIPEPTPMPTPEPIPTPGPTPTITPDPAPTPTPGPTPTPDPTPTPTPGTTPTPGQELPYVDVAENDWFYEYVKDTYYKNLMTGMEKTIFGPVENLSRAQFALILYRMEGESEVTGTVKFPDVENDTWYTDAVIWASEAMIITGYAEGSFGPADIITREQMATMMFRYAKYKEKDVSILAALDVYPDAEHVSSFAEDAMRWCVHEGIITGRGEDVKTLEPQGQVSRAECATIISRYVNKK